MPVDNAVRDGDEADPAKPDADDGAICTFNGKIREVERAEICLVPSCDGLTMTRKKDGAPPNWRHPPPLAFVPPIGYSPPR